MRYHPLLVVLHWLMALCFLLMLAGGLAMQHLELDSGLKFRLFQWHKSLGVLLLLACILRLSVRFFTKVPPLPAAIPPLERRAAKAGHALLYVWMLALPLAGWLTVSSSTYGIPTIVFGWFEWPHIPGVAFRADISEAAEETHALLAYGFMALIAAHVAAVIRHALARHGNLLPRMGIGRHRV